MALIIHTRFNGGPFASTFQPGDFLVAVGLTTSSFDPALFAPSGCGATWSRVFLGEESAVWVGINPVDGGADIATPGANSAFVGQVRGSDPSLATAYAYHQIGGAVGVVAAPPVPLGDTQAVFAMAYRATPNAFDPSSVVPPSWVQVGSGSSYVAGSGSGPYGSPVSAAAYFDSATQRSFIQVTIGTPPPNPPTGLTLTPGVDTIHATWTAPTGAPAIGYTVKLDTGAVVDVGNVLAYDFTGLTPSTTYAVEVRAYNAGGSSAPVSGSATTTAPVVFDSRYWTARLAQSLGLDPLTTQPVVEVRTWDGAAFTLDPDLSHALAGYSVTYGRTGATGPADPLKATITLATRQAPASPEAGTRLQVALCEPVATALGLTADEAVRFTGEVTDPAVNHATRLTTLVGIGRLGRANRAPVDGQAWPVEDDGDRVARIVNATGLALTLGTVDAGSVLLAPPTRSEPAVKLLDLAVNSTGGQVVEQPHGVIDWHDADHRRGVNPALTLDAAEVFRAITWAQRVGEVVNSATVKYGADESVEVVDPYSADPVTGYGPYPASVDTVLVDEDDAYALGTLLVGRRSRPAWSLPDVLVDLIRTIPLADLPQLLTLRHGNRLLIDGLPEGCPVSPKVFVEGWTETATPFQWRLTIGVSDSLLSGISPRYVDVPATDSYQYQDISPAMTYLGVARTEDPAELL